MSWKDEEREVKMETMNRCRGVSERQYGNRRDSKFTRTDPLEGE